MRGKDKYNFVLVIIFGSRDCRVQKQNKISIENFDNIILAGEFFFFLNSKSLKFLQLMKLKRKTERNKTRMSHVNM